ncbi:MAG: SIMPL domain-containing protein [Nitrososphaerota archaeon]|nr:SIMPL domain-containing protein [Candidatus Calditenuaceae archaeon]MDW8073601.1 SIMPL domain-containing protein [Nitrososphaerota archaeon]
MSSTRVERFPVYAMVVAVLAIASVLAVSLYAMNILGGSERTAPVQETGTVEEETGIQVPVRGVGIIKLKPDKLSFTLGVETRGETPIEASTRNNEIMSKVISSLLASGVDEKKITTSYLAINPDWVCDAEGCRQKGYVAVNQVTVTLEDRLILESPKIINDAIQAGATHLYGAWFDVKDETKKNLRDAALQAAFSDAAAKASRIAEYLNMRIKEIKYVEVSFPEDGGIPVPYVTRATAAPESVSGPPVMTGEITYTVTVYITYLFEPIS